jgi:hypothetical protein
MARTGNWNEPVSTQPKYDGGSSERDLGGSTASGVMSEALSAEAQLQEYLADEGRGASSSTSDPLEIIGVGPVKLEVSTLI